MKFDLDKMSEAELRALNYEIYKRLEVISHTRQKIELMSFRVGDQVEFDDGRQIVSGIVVRINHKTASIETDDGPGYRVSPSLLRKVRGVQESPQGNLFHLYRESSNS